MSKHLGTTITSIAAIAIALTGCGAVNKFTSHHPQMTQEQAKQSAHINKHLKPQQNPSDITDSQTNNNFQGKIQPKITKKQIKFTKPMKYRKHRIFKMLNLDKYGRALGSHIQLSENQTPTVKRSAYLTVRPSGWHNYKFDTNKGNNSHYKTWLFNRGHLVGYQFCGLNNEPKNLITETTYLNQGSLTGMDDKNQDAMLFYENGLRNWMRNHPKDKLDYSVVPLYHGKELVARQVQLKYVGLTPKNKKIRINLHQTNPQKSVVQTVKLNNDSPQAEINYSNGFARVFNSKGRPEDHYGKYEKRKANTRMHAIYNRAKKWHHIYHGRYRY